MLLISITSSNHKTIIHLILTIYVGGGRVGEEGEGCTVP